MLWATDFFPLWKKVSGVQILLARRLLRGKTCMGPSNFSLSSLQLWRKKTSMVYSWGKRTQTTELTNAWWPLLTLHELFLRLMAWLVDQSIESHHFWGIWNTNTRKSKHFPLKIHPVFKRMHNRHIVTSQLCYLCFFFYSSPIRLPFNVQRTGGQVSPSRENPCTTSVSCFINIQQSFSVVTNARGVNESEWIQEVARRKEFISHDPFSANCVLATEVLRQLQNSVCAGWMQLFQMEVSSRTTLQLSVIDKSHHKCLFLILFVLLLTRTYGLVLCTFFFKQELLVISRRAASFSFHVK